MRKIILLAIFLLVTVTPKVLACLSCSCQSSGVSSELGALSGGSGIFSKGKHFMFQFGSSFLSTTGSVNELGNWNPTPLVSSIYTMQNTMSMMYFPTSEISLGLQVPFVANILSKATWGNFGSIAPTALSQSMIGTSLGDLSFQGTYKIYDDNISNFASSIWGKVDLPTGQATGRAESLSGSGVSKITGGFFAIKRLESFELIGNLGYQKPLGNLSYNNFSIGNALMYQGQANYQVNHIFKVGLGFIGVLGEWLYNKNNNAILTNKIKLVATSQYDFSFYEGISLALSYDPQLFGRNTTTDTALNIVFYQYF